MFGGRPRQMSVESELRFLFRSEFTVLLMMFYCSLAFLPCCSLAIFEVQRRCLVTVRCLFKYDISPYHWRRFFCTHLLSFKLISFNQGLWKKFLDCSSDLKSLRLLVQAYDFIEALQVSSSSILEVCAQGADLAFGLPQIRKVLVIHEPSHKESRSIRHLSCIDWVCCCEEIFVDSLWLV